MAAMPDTAKALQVHLENFTNTTELDTKLVDTFRAQLTEQSIQTSLPIFLPLLTKALPLTSNPQPLTLLLLTLLEPIPFSTLLTLTTPAELLPTLNFPAASIQVMGLKLLQKATASASEAQALANIPELVASIVRLSLVAANTEVAELASKILIDLMAIDHTAPGGGGEGLIWRRVFGDKDIYQSIFDNCSWRNKSASMSRAEKTLAQARLLAMIPKMASLNWDMISRSHFPQIEARFEGDGTLDGILGFATAMVEMEFDVLMYMTVIEFYSEFILVCPSPAGGINGTETYTTSKGLEYLIDNNRHQSTIALYTNSPSEQSDQFTASFLTSRSARYIATYATHFPSHLAAQKDLLPKIRKAIKTHVPGLTNDGPHSPSLHLLACLPPSEIIDIVTEIPLAPPHPDYISTLATVLPSNETLYKRYVATHPSFYKKMIDYSSVVALKENALSSLQLLKSLASTPYGLRDIVSTTTVMEFLVTVPQKFSAGAGRGGDEAAAYAIARRRWETIETVAKGISVSGPEYDNARKVWGLVVNQRVAGGVYPSGGASAGVGGSVGWQNA